MAQGSSESRRSFYRSQTLRRNVLSREFLFSIKRSFSLSLLLTPSLCENNMLRVSWSPDLLLKSRLRRALAKLCEGKGENSCFIEIAFLEKETISHAQCAFYIDKHRKGRLLRENSFCLKKTFSFIRFFFFSFFL